jgi:hypothetical protein
VYQKLSSGVVPCCAMPYLSLRLRNFSVWGLSYQSSYPSKFIIQSVRRRSLGSMYVRMRMIQPCCNDVLLAACRGNLVDRRRVGTSSQSYCNVCMSGGMGIGQVAYRRVGMHHLGYMILRAWVWFASRRSVGAFSSARTLCVRIIIIWQLMFNVKEDVRSARSRASATFSCLLAFS